MSECDPPDACAYAMTCATHKPCPCTRYRYPWECDCDDLPEVDNPN